MERRPVVAAAVSSVARRAAALVAIALAVAPARARGQGTPAADDLTDDRILDTSVLRLESVSAQMTTFDQYGHGYQSQAGPVLGPGSERTTIFEPEEEIVISHGDTRIICASGVEICATCEIGVSVP